MEDVRKATGGGSGGCDGRWFLPRRPAASRPSPTARQRIVTAVGWAEAEEDGGKVVAVRVPILSTAETTAPPTDRPTAAPAACSVRSFLRSFIRSRWS